MTDPRGVRMGEIVGAVARQALADRGLARIALLDDGSEQADLAARLMGVNIVDRVTEGPAGVEPLLPEHRTIAAERLVWELRRLNARLSDALPAHPANKTELLLGGELPPEPLLPLGDLWATDVAALGAAWSAPAELRQLARAAEGIDRLDEALRRLVDGRDPRGLDELPREVRDDVRRRLVAGAASRRNPRLVPKLGGRTIGTDLFE